MLLDLPAWGISCVYWTSVRTESSPPPTQDSPLCWNQLVQELHARLVESPKNRLWSVSKSKERVWHWNGLRRTHDIEVKQKKCSLTRPASLGIQGGGGLQKVVGRIEFLGLKVVPHTLLTPRCASWITIQCWIGIKMKWGGWKEKGWLEWKVRFSFWALGTPL